jgi:hypothetical protein
VLKKDLTVALGISAAMVRDAGRGGPPGTETTVAVSDEML